MDKASAMEMADYFLESDNNLQYIRYPSDGILIALGDLLRRYCDRDCTELAIELYERVEDLPEGENYRKAWLEVQAAANF